jgi:UDP-N-acetylglucosamine--N-acetylmuramyl-(pentapeptide) pyrophosphoryl-undecaprenol N-acetylglucosamine transferase
MTKLKVLVSGGGTGGHIFPAIAIVEALQKLAEIEVLFVGANGRMEMEKVPACGYNIVGLPIAGFQRGLTISNILKNIQLPFKVIFSLAKVFKVIHNFKPNVAIGTGGYASAPTLKMAQWMGVPTFIQEQNAQPGKTNLFLGNNVKAAFVSYEESLKYFPNCEVIYTGNAIRESFSNNEVDRNEAFKFFNLNPAKKTIFITGGSLGARAINEGIEAQIEKINAEDIQVIWHTGKAHFDKFKKYETDKIRIYDFIYEMQKVYACADLVVTRAGGVLFELFVVGKPAIVLPSPYVADDHQTPNAVALANKNAAIMLKDNEANEKLVPTILDLIHDEEKIKSMSEVMKSLAKPNAATEIAKHILTSLNPSHLLSGGRLGGR